MKSNDSIIVSKRAQVDASNKSMFIRVAIASAVLGLTIVVSVFLFQVVVFNGRVLMEKNKTVSTLDDNIKNVEVLKTNIRKIDTNKALIDSKAKPDDQAVQVILDALPSEPNDLALGASLQNKLLNNFSLESLKVDSGIVSSDAYAISSTASANELTFSFVATGSEGDFVKILNNLEKSIRSIDITNLNVENQKMTVKARAFYEPARVIKLKDKTIK